MENFRNSLLLNLQTGFINRIFPSSYQYIPQLLVNDKSTGRKVLTTINKELKNCDEFWFSVAFVTKSGIATIINELNALYEKGIKGKILVSQYLNFTQPEALRSLLYFSNIELKIAVEGDFHSKGYLFKHGEHYDLIIGSSNLTSNALCTNIEWNLKISATPESTIISNTINEFKIEFDKAITVDENFIIEYEKIYNFQFESTQLIQERLEIDLSKEIFPNSMQIEALKNIEQLRIENKNKALLISATGTGKTYLTAFDVKRFNPDKFLFVVHRANIALTSMKAFKRIFRDSKKMGFYSGSERNLESDFIFSTVQTISKEEHLAKFEKSQFDYIVIDETHRAGAKSYERILNYFQPKFLLGMTATPERTDGVDIFKIFDHNIAYEIRLIKAMEEDMLSPFHYYGVTDITVNGQVLEDNSEFSLLTSPERIKHIIEKAKLYGCDNGIVRGLIFCSNVKECEYLSSEFNKLDFNTVALTGENSEEERSDAINKLENDNLYEKIDYIFTVNIFNEGIDIPRVNQIIMLRPTQSAIIFVQQLGRGLRKTNNKEYLTVIDFIGNYSNNYLVPVALYGDSSYNKDSLRKLVSNGNSLIPGTSTINFDKISLDRIYKSIDSARMNLKRDLVNDYNLLKFKLGRIPMMVDFLEHGSRDPQLYAEYSKSYFNFVQKMEESLKDKLNEKESKLLELFSIDINNSKRVEESFILKLIIKNKKIKISAFKKSIKNEYGYKVKNETIDSCINNLNFQFITEKSKKKLLTVGEIHDLHIIKRNGNYLRLEPEFNNYLKNPTFKTFLLDSINYSIKEFNRLFDRNKFCNGFI